MRKLPEAVEEIPKELEATMSGDHMGLQIVPAPNTDSQKVG